jgi:hypothetical protein
MILLVSTAVRLTLRSVWSQSNGYWRVLPSGVKRSGHEADHSHQCSSEVKNGGPIPSLPHTSSRFGTYLSTGTSLPLASGSAAAILYTYTVGRTPWTGDQPVTRPLPTHGTAQIQNKRRRTSITRVGFEPMPPALKRAKAVETGRPPWSANFTFTLSGL